MSTLYVTFPDYNHAERAVAALLDNGVSKVDISLVSNHPEYTSRDAYGNALDANGNFADPNRNPAEDARNPVDDASSGVTTTTAADSGKGAAEGAGIGLGLGILAGLASLVVPGFGLVLGGGALATALGIAGVTTVGGAVVGAVTGSLIDMGVPANSAETYSDHLSGGGALVSVRLPSGNVDQANAADILRKYDGSNINVY
jgi:hypothetical protein